jgi:hypothetical protein
MDSLEFVVYLFLRRPFRKPPQRKVAHNFTFNFKWKPVDEQANKMRFYKKVAVWRLDIVSGRDPTNFLRKLVDLLLRSHVLDNRITVAEVKGLIVKRKLVPIVNDKAHARTFPFFALYVNERNVRSQVNQSPIKRRVPNIDNMRII